MYGVTTDITVGADVGLPRWRMLLQLVRTAAQASHPHHATTTLRNVAVLSRFVARRHTFSLAPLTCLILSMAFRAGVCGWTYWSAALVGAVSANSRRATAVDAQ